MERILISTQGFEKVKQELEELKKERPEVIQAIKEAREEGDLRENAGYDAARERQGLLEARINNLEYKVPRFEVIDLEKLKAKSKKKAYFGATVELLNLDTDEEKIYTILGADESDYEKGIISILSPVAKALLGKEVGDEIIVTSPAGVIDYEITSISYLGNAVMSGT